MKDIWVTSRNNVAKWVDLKECTHVISLVDYGKVVFVPHQIPKENWMRLNFKDLLDKYQSGGPTRHDVVRILEFGKNLPEDAILLVHCEAGISRSTSAALSLLVQKNGPEKLDECYKLLLEKRPQAVPNPVICEYADEILGCEGKLHKIGVDAWEKNLNW